MTERTADSHRGHDEVVLLVENDERLRRGLRHALLKQGYGVLEATNGREALELLDHEGAQVSLVLTDLTMPEMSGGELIKAIRKRHLDIKIVAMSGWLGDSIEECQVILKPFLPSELAVKLREVLDGEPSPVKASS